MEIKSVLIDQYGAAMEMLRQAILKCPPSLWVGGDQGRKPFWQVAYHALFYTHLYLQDGLKGFKPWARHRMNINRLGVEVSEPYSQAEVLEFYDLCCQAVVEKVTALDLVADSGFEWLPFSKLELQLYNIRHIQHHAAELIEYLGAQQGIEVDWVGMAPGSQ